MPATFINLFDIVGPIMIGPSSSHTAGAAKIGFEAYKLLKEEPIKIRIKLYNSFSDTGKGHKTDLALLGGCLGIQPQDEKLIQAEEIAQNKDIDYKIKWGYHSPDLHPNTAIINLTGKEKEAGLVGYSIGGGRIQIAKKYVRTKGSKKEKGLEKPAKKSYSKSKENYFTFEEIKANVNTGNQLLNLALVAQSETGGQDKEEILNEFEKRWQIMVRSIQKGISSRQRAEDNMYGGDSYRIRRSKLNVLSQVIENGVFYAIGVAEHNAKMGKIVAAPTAGSAGVMPGVLRAMQEKFNYSDRQMAEALTVAAAVGAVIANKVELAGAVAGCQAEIGAGGTMTAAAGVYLLNGNIDAIEAAASLVLANMLGLTCDPVMGRVEVPCILRNGTTVGLTFTAIEMALDNVRYSIPFDEVVDVMKKVGEDMHAAYKETSQGGLAKTETARLLCQNCPGCG
jgi:L-serine dehydratase